LLMTFIRVYVTRGVTVVVIECSSLLRRHHGHPIFFVVVLALALL
jgi:hypothetical protein